MRLEREQRRVLGALALLVGIGMAVGGIAYGQLRFPMTNYTSTITVENPVAYYEHELRAGDTLFFHIEVTGPPLDMEVRRETAPDPEELVLAATVDRWELVPFAVPATGTYSVIFRSTCESCGPTLVRAQVDQALGSIGLSPLPVTVVMGIAIAGAGGWVVTFPRKPRDKP